MPKWTQYLEDEYSEEKPIRSFEKFKPRKKTEEEIRGAKKKTKPLAPPAPHKP